MVALTQPIPQRKFPGNGWRIDHRPDRGRWETYRQSSEWPPGLYQWLFDTFGLNIGMNRDSNWDYHGGWIYFYKEECVGMFILRWS